jgi:hypothetical protein
VKNIEAFNAENKEGMYKDLQNFNIFADNEVIFHVCYCKFK